MGIISNGKEERTGFDEKTLFEFKKNTDYFEMSDGIFWTVDALMKKYDSGRSTIYNKARDNNIPTTKVLGIVTFKDSDKFKKLPGYKGNVNNLKPHQLTSYAELHRSVEQLIKEVRSATIPVDADTHSIHLELQAIRDKQKDTIELLNKIVDYLTQPEVVEVEKKNDK